MRPEAAGKTLAWTTGHGLARRRLPQDAHARDAAGDNDGLGPGGVNGPARGEMLPTQQVVATQQRVFRLYGSVKSGVCCVSRAAARTAFPVEAQSVAQAFKSKHASRTRVTSGAAAASSAAPAAAGDDAACCSEHITLHYRAGGSPLGELCAFAGARLTLDKGGHYRISGLGPVRRQLSASFHTPLRLSVLPCGRALIELAEPAETAPTAAETAPPAAETAETAEEQQQPRMAAWPPGRDHVGAPADLADLDHDSESSEASLVSAASEQLRGAAESESESEEESAQEGCHASPATSEPVPRQLAAVQPATATAEATAQAAAGAPVFRLSICAGIIRLPMATARAAFPEQVEAVFRAFDEKRARLSATANAAGLGSTAGPSAAGCAAGDSAAAAAAVSAGPACCGVPITLHYRTTAGDPNGGLCEYADADLICDTTRTLRLRGMGRLCRHLTGGFGAPLQLRMLPCGGVVVEPVVVAAASEAPAPEGVGLRRWQQRQRTMLRVRQQLRQDGETDGVAEGLEEPDREEAERLVPAWRALVLSEGTARGEYAYVSRQLIDGLLGRAAARSDETPPVPLYDSATGERIGCEGRLQPVARASERQGDTGEGERRCVYWYTRGMTSWLLGHGAKEGDRLNFVCEPSATAAAPAAAGGAGVGGGGAAYVPPRVYVELIRAPAHGAAQQRRLQRQQQTKQEPEQEPGQEQAHPRAGGGSGPAGDESDEGGVLEPVGPLLVTIKRQLSWMPQRTMVALLGQEAAASGVLPGAPAGPAELPLRLPPGQQLCAPTAAVKCAGTPEDCKSARWSVVRLGEWLRRLGAGPGSTFRFRAVRGAASTAAGGGAAGGAQGGGDAGGRVGRVVAIEIALVQRSAAGGAAAGPAAPRKWEAPAPDEEAEEPQAGGAYALQRPAKRTALLAPQLPPSQPLGPITAGGSPAAAVTTAAVKGVRGRGTGGGGWRPHAQLAAAGAADGVPLAQAPATPAAATGRKRDAGKDDAHPMPYSQQQAKKRLLTQGPASGAEAGGRGGARAAGAAGVAGAAVAAAPAPAPAPAPASQSLSELDSDADGDAASTEAARLPEAVKRHYPKAYKLTLGAVPAVAPLALLKRYTKRIGWQPPEMELERVPAPEAAAAPAAGGGAGSSYGACYRATVTLQSSKKSTSVLAIGRVGADKETARQLVAAACLQQLRVLGVSRKRITGARKAKGAVQPAT